MFNYSETKKIILASLLALGIVLAAYFSPKIDLEQIKLKLEKFIQKIDNKFSVFGQEIVWQVFPRYPYRLVHLASNLASQSETLFLANEEMTRLVKNCDCRNAQSSCISTKTLRGSCLASTLRSFGDPCSNVRNTIESKQIEIDETIRQINYLQSLLKKEIESGLDEELRKIMPESFEKIKTEIEQLFQESQKIISTAENNRNLPDQDVVSKCSANCKLGNIFGLKACLKAGTGEQRQIELKYKIGITLEDLELGQVGIKNINLSLPEKIEIPKFGNLSPFTIIGDRIAIDIEDIKKIRIPDFKPTSLQLQAPSLPSLPKPPTLSFSCPDLEKYFSSYECSSDDETTESDSIDIEWFLKVFSYLSERCQELPTLWELPGIFGEKAENCFDPERIVTFIVNQCDRSWRRHCRRDETVELADICLKIRYGCDNSSVLDGNIAAAIQCQNLFKQEGLTIPPQCSYVRAFSGRCPHSEYPTPYPTPKVIFCLHKNFDPVSALKNKCNELKPKYYKKPPEPCKILPLFIGQLENPGTEIYASKGGNCSKQRISDTPRSIPGCGASPPTIPKIKLPKIIVRDIILPSFKIWPFLEIKLPSFIFEDLVLQDIELCDLDNCRDIFPSFKFKFPVLNLPKIDLPPIELGEVLGVPLPDIQLSSIRLPPIPFPTLKLPSLSDLITVDLDLPSISLPKPKITFKFSGIDLKAIFAYIVTFITNALGIPDFSLCVDFKLNLNLIPLKIIFPDYHLYWPTLPQIPEIPFCKDIKQFCQDIKTKLTKLKEFTDKIKGIEETFNKFIQREIQEKINQAVIRIHEKYKQHILQELEKQREKIRKEAEEQIRRGEKIIVISVDDIKMPSISLDEELRLPNEISIPWPEELKKIQLSCKSDCEQCVSENKKTCKKFCEQMWEKKCSSGKTKCLNECYGLIRKEKCQEECKGCLNYELPIIPLCGLLNYEKEFLIKGPGFQARTLSAELGVYADCLAGPPSGGNPYPINQFQSNLNKIKDTKTNLQEISQRIIWAIQPE